MTLGSIKKELQEEAVATRNIFKAVDYQLWNYKPHEKSMELGVLATHLAEIATWVNVVLNTSELDFEKEAYKPTILHSTDELLAFFDENMKKAYEVLSEKEETVLTENWTMRAGEMIYFTLPKADVIRTWVLNHIVHHRAQLGVYLRLNNIPLPSTYGPSAG